MNVKLASLRDEILTLRQIGWIPETTMPPQNFLIRGGWMIEEERQEVDQVRWFFASWHEVSPSSETNNMLGGDPRTFILRNSIDMPPGNLDSEIKKRHLRQFGDGKQKFEGSLL
ncbi:hypothetical protein [Streptomyces sp. NPDC002156]